MFSSRTSTLGERALGALGLIRSFLLLEDDCEVDWEVGQDERFEVDHPHRAALRGRAATERLARRRPGQPAPSPHVCLSPVSGRSGHSPGRPRTRRLDSGGGAVDRGAAESDLRVSPDR